MLRALIVPLFRSTARVMGIAYTDRVCARWREVFLAHPELIQDIEIMAELDELPVDENGNSLSPHDLAMRAGAQRVGLALLARGGVTRNRAQMIFEDTSDDT